MSSSLLNEMLESLASYNASTKKIIYLLVSCPNGQHRIPETDNQVEKYNYEKFPKYELEAVLH